MKERGEMVILSKLKTETKKKMLKARKPPVNSVFKVVLALLGIYLRA